MNRQLVAILAGLAVAAIVSFGISFLLASAGAEPLSSDWVLGVTLGTMTTVIMLGMSGNKRVAKADTAARAAALALAPAPGKGMLVVFREGFMGKSIGTDIVVDGREVSQLKSSRFTALDLAPGAHTLTVILAGAANAASKPGEAAFDLAAGEAIVFRIALKMKLSTSDVVLTRADDLTKVKTVLARMTMMAAKDEPARV